MMNSVITDTTVSLATSEEEPILDTEQIKLLATVAEDSPESLLQELLGLFISENGPRIGLITEAYERGDATEVHKSAHCIAGSSANLGGKRLSKTCFRLESLAQEGMQPEMAELISRIEDAYQSTLDAYREVIAKKPGS